MGQTSNAPRVNENEARAFGKQIRTSGRKLNLVAHMIRGKSAQHALADLTFCERRIAREVKKILQAAIANAENNHQLDVDRLYVHEATVGRAFVMKRFHARGRGKSTRIEKPFSNLTVIVKERSNTPAPAKKAEAAAEPVKTEAKAKKSAAKTATAKKPAAKPAAQKTKTAEV